MRKYSRKNRNSDLNQLKKECFSGRRPVPALLESRQYAAGGAVMTTVHQGAGDSALSQGRRFLHRAFVVAGGACSYPQRRSAHRHLPGDALPAGLRSGVWCVRRGMAARGGDALPVLAAIHSRSQRRGSAAAIAECADRKVLWPIGWTAGLSSRIRTSSLSGCGIFLPTALRSAGERSLTRRRIAFFSLSAD